jgi:DNA/RNA endonuclease G (NUC1)
MTARVDDATLRAFLRRIAGSRDLAELVEGAGVRDGAGDPMRRPILEKLARGQPLAPAERFHLEAIIIPDRRPAIDIVDGDFTSGHGEWLHLNDAPIRGRLRGLFPAIGRIELSGHPSLPYGGTGFVVGAGLLMTNRHVAEIFAEGLGVADLRFIPGLGAGVDFLREAGRDREDFLRVERVAMIHPYWDMALLVVDGLRETALALATADPAPETEVAVLGYPAFDPRNPADVQNKVFGGLYGVKRLQPGRSGEIAAIASYGHAVEALLHDSSTLGGNSGSCVIDLATGEVVGLHFGGRYAVANHCVPAAALATDGRVIDAGVGFAGPVARRPTPWDAAWRGLEAPAPETAPAGEVRLVIPLEITVRLGTPQPVGAATPPLERMVAPIHDGNYADRPGYDPAFLGLPVPLPTLRRPEVAARLDDGGHVIPYHHFSLVMHRARRLALFTAANVDARPEVKRPGNRPEADYSRKGLSGLGPNDRERWFPDPRLPEDAQLPERFYDRDRRSFDKGHVVRREDVAWGTTYEEMRFANGDTFHVTNCSPQIAAFNRSGEGEDNWGDLEVHVLAEAGAERLAVFAGPVLADDDPVFTDENGLAARVPRRFWKLIVAAAGGRALSFGFRLEQDLTRIDLEFAVPERWRRLMVGVREIEDLAGIDFDSSVRDGDQAATDAGARLCAQAGLESAVATRPGKEKAAPRAGAALEP